MQGCGDGKKVNNHKKGLLMRRAAHNERQAALKVHDHLDQNRKSSDPAEDECTKNQKVR